MGDLEGRKAEPDDWGKPAPAGYHWQARGLDWYLAKDGKKLDTSRLPPLTGPMGEANPHEYIPRFEVPGPSPKPEGFLRGLSHAKRRANGILVTFLGIGFLVNGQGWELAIGLGLIALGLLLVFG